jgi:hypothetical protein
LVQVRALLRYRRTPLAFGGKTERQLQQQLHAQLRAFTITAAAT